MGRVYVATTGNTAINSTTDVTLRTLTVTSLVAGEQIVVDGMLILHNDGGSNETYVITIDFDALGDVEFTTASITNSTTSRVVTTFKALLDIRSTSLCYGQLLGFQDIAIRTSGGDSTMAATHLYGKGWFSSTADATGSTDVTLKIRSSSATTTQTGILVGFFAEVPAVDTVVTFPPRPTIVNFAVTRATTY